MNKLPCKNLRDKSLDILRKICYNNIINSEVKAMLWKMKNVQLNKGVFFTPYGDSAPFFKLVCHKQRLCP